MRFRGFRIAFAAALAALVASSSAGAETLDEAAASVQKAVAAGDSAALEAAAAKDQPDPWLVAEQLLVRGDAAAAARFAKAKPRKDVEKLPAYVAAQSGKPVDAALRARTTRINGLLAANKPDEALALCDTDPAGGDVNAILLWGLRGLALEAKGRHKDSIAPFLAGGELAERLGWLARASSLYQSAGLGGYHGGDAVRRRPRGNVAQQSSTSEAQARCWPRRT